MEQNKQQEVATVNDKQLKAFMARQSGISAQEIAKQLKCSVGTVNNYCSAVNMALKNTDLKFKENDNLLDLAFPLAYNGLLKNLKKNKETSVNSFLRGRGHYRDKVDVNVTADSSISELMDIINEGADNNPNIAAMRDKIVNADYEVVDVDDSTIIDKRSVQAIPTGPAQQPDKVDTTKATGIEPANRQIDDSGSDSQETGIDTERENLDSLVGKQGQADSEGSVIEGSDVVDGGTESIPPCQNIPNDKGFSGDNLSGQGFGSSVVEHIDPRDLRILELERELGELYGSVDTGDVVEVVEVEGVAGHVPRATIPQVGRKRGPAGCSATFKERERLSLLSAEELAIAAPYGLTSLGTARKIKSSGRRRMGRKTNNPNRRKRGKYKKKVVETSSDGD